MPTDYLNQMRRSWNQPFNSIRKKANAKVEQCLLEFKQEKEKEEIEDAVEEVRQEWRQKQRRD